MLFSSILLGKLRFTSVTITIRLLPLQVLGKQATNTAYKAKACERMLQLESDNNIAQMRLRSLMSDMGTESGLWSLPDLKDPSKRYFPYILPVADCDHGMHHCMQETEGGYEHSTWSKYIKQLNGFSKLFGRRETVDRFVHFQIFRNSSIPAFVKKSFEAMFKYVCPSLCQHRWMYAFEVLRWLCQRETFFKYLDSTLITHDRASDGDGGLSAEEGAALKQIISDPAESALFWGIAWAEYVLHSWGFGVYDWMHRCPCHTVEENKNLKSPCQWNGRRLIELANGKMQERVFSKTCCDYVLRL